MTAPFVHAVAAGCCHRQRRAQSPSPEAAQHFRLDPSQEAHGETKNHALDNGDRHVDDEHQQDDAVPVFRAAPEQDGGVEGQRGQHRRHADDQPGRELRGVAQSSLHPRQNRRQDRDRCQDDRVERHDRGRPPGDAVQVRRTAQPQKGDTVDQA